MQGLHPMTTFAPVLLIRERTACTWLADDRETRNTAPGSWARLELLRIVLESLI